MELRYTADVYYRLSKEDMNRGDESCSIGNQRMIVERYCRENNIVIVREFVDDGYSGGNFDRPGFKAMLEHIEKEKIGMVITKDLSRLCRDLTDPPVTRRSISRSAARGIPPSQVLSPAAGQTPPSPFFDVKKLPVIFSSCRCTIKTQSDFRRTAQKRGPIGDRADVCFVQKE